MSETTESVSIPDGSPGRVPIREWTVEVTSGPDQGKRVSALQGLVRVGSDAANDLVLSDSTVSRRHLEVEHTQQGLLLRDLNSRNGTYLCGRLVLLAYLEPNDRIELGKTKLIVRQKSVETEIELDEHESFGELVGLSQAMRILFAELARVARDDISLLIEGETGTGKELAARAVHARSNRKAGPFRVLDSALVTEASAERELFGPDGAFSNAQGGTLFLDEIAELPLPVQPWFLRILETKTLPNGKPLDARIIAATTRNLAEEVQQGRFRQELYFRLAVVRARIPPLRTRKNDIPVLARHLMKGLSAPVELSPQMLALLEGYDWPGNVRELRNVLERGALLQATGDSDWLELLVPSATGPGRESLIEAATRLPYHEAKDRVVADFERHYFAEVMRAAGFDMKIAEERTGLSMQSLYRLLKKNGLRLKDLRNADDL